MCRWMSDPTSSNDSQKLDYTFILDDILWNDSQIFDKTFWMIFSTDVLRNFQDEVEEESGDSFLCANTQPLINEASPTWILTPKSNSRSWHAHHTWLTDFSWMNYSTDKRNIANTLWQQKLRTLSGVPAYTHWWKKPSTRPYLNLHTRASVSALRASVTMMTMMTMMCRKGLQVRHLQGFPGIWRLIVFLACEEQPHYLVCWPAKRNIQSWVSASRSKIG